MMDHQTCSEQLAAYVRGGLDPALRKQVEEHLGGCEECRKEEKAASLLSQVSDQMSELERASLHRSLAAARSGKPSWGRKAVPVLGAAAAAAVLFFGMLGGSEEDASETSAGSAGADRDTQQLFGTPVPDEAGEVLDQAAEMMAPPQPTFASVGSVTAQKMSRLGRSRSPFVEFAGFYSVEDAEGLLDPFARDLARQAPDPDLTKQVKRCIGAVTRRFPYHFLPAFGAAGQVDGRPALIVGFTWTEHPIGALDQYMVWAWPGGNCDTTQPLYVSGKIEVAARTAKGAGESE